MPSPPLHLGWEYGRTDQATPSALSPFGRVCLGAEGVWGERVSGGIGVDRSTPAHYTYTGMTAGVTRQVLSTDTPNNDAVLTEIEVFTEPPCSWTDGCSAFELNIIEEEVI